VAKTRAASAAQVGPATTLRRSFPSRATAITAALATPPPAIAAGEASANTSGGGSARIAGAPGICEHQRQRNKCKGPPAARSQGTTALVECTGAARASSGQWQGSMRRGDGGGGETLFGGAAAKPVIPEWLLEGREQSCRGEKEGEEATCSI
jgi:hypothetical protein